MATATVSASVDTTTKTIANAYIRKAGLTPNELIRRLWESIASTGTIPEFPDGAEVRRQNKLKAFQESQTLIDQAPQGTILDTMSYEDMRKELEHRDI